MKKIIGVVLSLVIIVGVLVACGKNNEQTENLKSGTRISNYKLSFAEDNLIAEEAAISLQEQIKVKCDIDLEILKDLEEKTENTIFFGGVELAEKTGTNLLAIENMGYCITKTENQIYIYSNTKKGFNRAVLYFEDSISEDGQNVIIEEERILDTGINCVDSIKIGEKSIEEYTIVIPEKADLQLKEAALELQYYIRKISGIMVAIQETNENMNTSILIYKLNTDAKEDNFVYKNSIEYGKIKILGKDSASCMAGVYDFINTYLGWSFAGDEREKISTKVKNIVIPETVILSEDTPWMEEREAIICLWKTNYSRGEYTNPNTSLLTDVISFSETQLYEYVKMLKHCGYTGIQVTDMCSAWGGSGDYEYVHERMRILSDAAHSMGMKFTIWVWGAEFDGYDWVDNEISYNFEGYTYLHKNPRANEMFDRVYSIYAEMADCADRVIVHYYDPGNIHASEDVAFYANMLKEKMQAVNPNIDFGVNCWIDNFDKEKLVEALGNDVTLYENSYWDSLQAREDFRNLCDGLGCRVGTWSWCIAEMEIDQLAQMNVNADIIKETYLKAIDVDKLTKKSTYWSEMDSYHVLNVFSLYCAGHLLANPEADPELLLREVAYATVGETYQNDFYEILDLIQDARSGDTYNKFRWEKDEYILKNDNYNAEEILERCNTYIPVLDEMIEQKIEANTLPLPITLVDLLQLIRPHLEQIRLFAEFKMGMNEIESLYASGTSKTELTLKMEDIYEPIPEFNCIIGLWGQIEARMQYIIVEEFCAKAGLETPRDETFTLFRKMRIYQELCTWQKGNYEPYKANKDFFQWGIAYGKETTIALTNELVEEGLFLETEDEQVYLADWKNYIFDFK